MDRFVVLSNVDKAGLEKLLELQKEGIIRIVESEATIIAWLTPDGIKEIVEDALEHRGIEVSPEQLDELIEETHYLWQRSTRGTTIFFSLLSPYDEIYYVACDAIDNLITS